MRDVDAASRFGYSFANGNNASVSKQLLHDKDFFSELDKTSANTHDEGAHKQFQIFLSKLPGKADVEKLANSYFVIVNWQYSFLERYDFYKLLRQWQTLTAEGSTISEGQDMQLEMRMFPALLFQVLALALQFLPNDLRFPGLLESTGASSYDSLAYHYSQMGMQLLDLSGRLRGNLIGVQHDLLRASVLKNFGRITESWHAHTNAIRQAQDLGLHRQSAIQKNGTEEVKNTLALVWHDEMKRRLWLNLFVWDAAMAMILGRPRTINMDDCNFKPPTDCIYPENPLNTVPLPIQPGEKPSAFSERLIEYQLSLRIHEMRRLRTEHRHPKDYAVIQKLHVEALSLLDAAPPFLQTSNPDTSWDVQCPYLPAQREQVAIVVNAYLVALHRPHVIDRVESRNAVWNATSVVLESLQRMFETSTVHAYKHFMLSFFTVDAALLLSAMAIRFPKQDQTCNDMLLQNLKNALDRLQALRVRSSIAAAGLPIIRQCCRQVWKTYGVEYDDLDQMKEVSSPEETRETEEHVGSRDKQSQRDSELISSDATSTLPQNDTEDWFVGPITDFDPSVWLEQMDEYGGDVLDISVA